MNNTSRSMTDWAQKMEERPAKMENVGGDSRKPWEEGNPISEVKAVTNLEQLGTDESKF